MVFHVCSTLDGLGRNLRLWEHVEGQYHSYVMYTIENACVRDSLQYTNMIYIYHSYVNMVNLKGTLYLSMINIDI
jgi:hypothetical protein